MFGAVAFSIVLTLTLAVGPSASLLCRSWCDPEAAASSGCHHEDTGTSPSVASTETCDTLLPGAAFVREDVRQFVSSPDGEDAVPVAGYQVTRSSISVRPGDEPGHQWSLQQRPRPTVLRI